MRECHCNAEHERKRVVLTGGPGAGKTAVLELARHYFCRHVMVLPDAAGMVFRGGFPRSTVAHERAAAQRAIYHVQRELESVASHRPSIAVILCDRGTLDGAAYWPGPNTLWSSLGTSRLCERTRYDTVIHLRTFASTRPSHASPLQVEGAEDPTRLDMRIAEEWDGHSRREFIEGAHSILERAHAALSRLQLEIPRCCR